MISDEASVGTAASHAVGSLPTDRAASTTSRQVVGTRYKPSGGIRPGVGQAACAASMRLGRGRRPGRSGVDHRTRTGTSNASRARTGTSAASAGGVSFTRTECQTPGHVLGHPSLRQRSVMTTPARRTTGMPGPTKPTWRLSAGAGRSLPSDRRSHRINYDSAWSQERTRDQ